MLQNLSKHVQVKIMKNLGSLTLFSSTGFFPSIIAQMMKI